MTNIRNFWTTHRDRIASIIFWPYVVSLVIFVAYSFCNHVQVAEDGFSSLPQALLWVITLMGGLITPVIAIRSWVAIFHDDADALTVVLASPVWGGGIIGAFENAWFGGLAMLLCLILLNYLIPGLFLTFFQAAVKAAMLVTGLVHLPMLVIGYAIHLRNLCIKKS